jgi:transposase
MTVPPCLFDGPINREAFLGYVQTLLVPTLKAGDVVIMDNLGSHRGKAVRKAIRAAGEGCSSCPSTRPI